MLTLTDIRNALTGSFLLVKHDTSGLQNFDTDLDGFWRSFLVIVPIAPFYVLFTAQDHQISQELNQHEVNVAIDVNLVVAKLVLLLLGWVLFPITMIFISRFLGLWSRFIPFIAVYNWSSLFVVLVLSPPALLYSLGAISALSVASLNMFGTFFAIYFGWYIAKTVLETTSMTATLIVAFDLVLSIFVQQIFGRLTGY